MKKIILVLLITFTALLADYVMKPDGTLTLKTGVQETVPMEPALPTEPASYTVIPGLYGFGTDTRAAYGGTVDPIVLHVDTLVSGVSNTDSTHGSFEWCLTQKYPRIVVFDVSGVIDSSSTIYIRNPYLTVAGQTAPDNIVLNGWGIRIYSHDVVIQHIAVRNKSEATGHDCITAVAADNGDVYNVVVDHCSSSWAHDESMSIGHTADRIIHDVTFSNCIIGASVNKNYGSLNYGKKLAHIGNLYIHNYMRSPQLGYNCELAVYNSITYNSDHSNTQMAGSLAEDVQKLTYIGNVTIAGPDSGTQDYQTALVKLLKNTAQPKENNIIYMEDNINRGIPVAADSAVWIGESDGYTVGSKLLPPNYVPKPASETKDSVLANVGSRPAYRDEVDTTLINDVINGTGEIISSVPALPAYPTNTQAFIPVSNPHAMYNANYTNLENQLHQLSVAVEK